MVVVRNALDILHVYNVNSMGVASLLLILRYDNTKN